LTGSGGIDLINGDDGDDTAVGGDNDDVVHLGIGNDRFIWNPGDDTDTVDGGDGEDIVEVNTGNGAEDFTITADATRVRLDRVNPAPFSIDIGTSEELVLNASGGNDTLVCSGNLAALIHITADGGAGDDVLLGGNGADMLLGGDGNDFLDGQQGADTALMGAGDDVFQWDPGDGSDIVEGENGTDTMVFNGNGANELFDLSADGDRLRFTRSVGEIIMDCDGLERIDLPALGNADTIVVKSLVGTDVAEVNIDLAAVPGDAAGDAQPDNIIVAGTEDPDTIDVVTDGGAILVSGLSALVRIFGAEARTDLLVVNGLGGADAITAAPGVADLIILQIVNE
jgi:Ca2+-binding RTX toxin-like protein